MSAFICSNETYSRIYSGIKVFGLSNLSEFSDISFTLKNHVLEGRTPEEFIDILYRLNVRAVNERYEESAAEELDKKMLQSLCVLGYNISISQWLKSLKCLRYQMSEGDVPSTKFYSQVEKLINAICEHIVTSTKEYEAAVWE